MKGLVLRGAKRLMRRAIPPKKATNLRKKGNLPRIILEEEFMMMERSSQGGDRTSRGRRMLIVGVG